MDVPHIVRPFSTPTTALTVAIVNQKATWGCYGSYAGKISPLDAGEATYEGFLGVDSLRSHRTAPLQRGMKNIDLKMCIILDH